MRSWRSRVSARSRCVWSGISPGRRTGCRTTRSWHSASIDLHLARTDQSARKRIMAEPIITLTDAAAERVKTLMRRAEDGVAGLRVGLSTRGCSGMSDVVEYASEAKQFEERSEARSVGNEGVRTC